MLYMSSEDAVHVCLLPLPFAVSFFKERGRRGKKGGKRDFPLQKENRVGSREAAISPSNPAWAGQGIQASNDTRYPLLSGSPLSKGVHCTRRRRWRKRREEGNGGGRRGEWKGIKVGCERERESGG